MLRLCVALFSSVLALSSLAAPQVFVVGLFPGAAVLNVDGQRKLVRVGQTGPQASRWSAPTAARRCCGSTASSAPTN